MKKRERIRIGFIGSGNMAGAMIKGIVAARLVPPGAILVSDVVRPKVQSLRRRFGVAAAPDNRALVAASSIVVLAVKPQSLPEVLDDLGGVEKKHALFVSIAAGFPLARLRQGLGADARLVRAMPNTPALLGKGMTVLVRGGKATSTDERKALGLFRAVGDAIAVRDEALLDPVTGVSGSGPAFVYLFAEALIAAGEREGLDPAISKRLVLQTLDGASAMLREAKMTPQGLREMVTSPGGTTRAGLDALAAGRFTDVVASAIRSATDRSRELGNSR